LNRGIRKRRFEIILPLQYNDGREIEHEKFFELHEQLLTKFGGFSYITGSFGAWRSPETGEVYSDMSTLFIILSDDNDSIPEFFRNFQKLLEKNFQQEKVMITHYRVYEL
jgi:hypothetical protein